MRRTVSKRLDGISVNAEQPKKQFENVMLEVSVPIDENNRAGIVRNELHSAKVESNEVIDVVAAKSSSGTLFIEVQPWNIPLTLVTLGLFASSVAGIESNDEQSAKVSVNCVAAVLAANSSAGMRFNEAQAANVAVNFNFAVPNGANKSDGIDSNFGQLQKR